jgi:hypothetical protein
MFFLQNHHPKCLGHRRDDGDNIDRLRGNRFDVAIGVKGAWIVTRFCGGMFLSRGNVARRSAVVKYWRHGLRVVIGLN